MTSTTMAHDAAHGAHEHGTYSGGIMSWITTVDHKRIGVMYFVSAFVFFLVGGLEALLIRLQLGSPENTMISADLYNQLFTMHGTTMVFLALMPLSSAFFNFLIPLQVGARDVAFPRLNAFSFWVFLFGGLLLNASFLFGGAPDGGWFGYANLTSTHLLAGHADRLLGVRPAGARRVVDRLGAELHRHDHQPPGARHEVHAHAAVHLDDADHLVPAHPVVPGDHDRARDADVRPHLRHRVLQPGDGRRRPAVAAPVLDLRPSRGLHPDPAGVRRDQRGDPDLLAEDAVRLPVHRLFGDPDRLPRLRRVGAPHVRDRPRTAGELGVQRGDHADRDPDRA